MQTVALALSPYHSGDKTTLLMHRLGYMTELVNMPETELYTIMGSLKLSTHKYSLACAARLD